MKKAIVLGVSLTVLIGAFVGIKYLNVGFKKVIEEPLVVLVWQQKQVISNDRYVKYVDEYDIVKDTTLLGGAQSKYYSKYIEYIAPNGKPIRLLERMK